MFLRYLIERGAHVGAVNSEGELPLDVATEDAMERVLKEEIKKQSENAAASAAVGRHPPIEFLRLGFRDRRGPGQKGGGAGHAPGRHGRAGRRRHALASPQHQGHRPARGLGKRLHRSPEVRTGPPRRGGGGNRPDCAAAGPLNSSALPAAPPLLQGAAAVRRGREQQGH